MAKKLIIFISTGLTIAIAFAFISDQLSYGNKGEKSRYRFQALEKDIFAEINYKIDQDHQGVIDVHYQEILDAHYKSLNDKLEEIQLLLIYLQFIEGKKSLNNEYYVQLNPTKRSLTEICTLYGRSCSGTVKIHFNKRQNKMLEFSGKNYDWSDLKKDILLQSVKTEILDYLISKAEKKYLPIILNSLAISQGLSKEELVDKVILSSSSREKINTYLKYNSDLFISSASEQDRYDLLQAYRKKIENYYVEEYVHRYINGPILINMGQPHFKRDIKWDWVPVLVDPPDNTLDVIVFFDFFSDTSRRLISDILFHQNDLNHVKLGLRPMAPHGDRFQTMLVEMFLCVWDTDRSKMKSFLQEAMFISRDKFEDHLNNVLKKINVDELPVKKCFLSHKMKDVIVFYEKTNEYYSLNTVPFVFIGTEVIAGPVDYYRIRKVINRNYELQ